MNRRRLLRAGAAGLAAASTREAAFAAPGPPQGGGRPVVIASANGHRFRNGGDATCVEKAFALLTSGAAGSTGRGEANLFGLSSFLVVEELRRGAHPKDAGMEALRRIRANTVEKRLLNGRGTPNFNVIFYVLDRSGRHAGVSLYGGREYAVCTGEGARILPCDALLPGRETD